MLDKIFDAASVEPRIAKTWDDANAFAAGAGAREGAEPYCIVIPPPNVTGSLHMGHALNNTLQDILIRYQRMLGNNVLWQPGMDHAGIATQMVVERQLAESGENMTRREMGREKFIDRVWQWKEQSGGQIFNQLKRLGASCDWSRERFTMDDGLSEAVLEVFVRLHKQGLIYRGKRLVNWDPKFETAISDLEVENIEIDGHMWHFKYPLAGGDTYEYIEKDEDGNVTLRETRDYISIATTRPETMLGDGAVAVHPDDERYAPIVGKLCEIPVGPKEHRRLIPIITDDYPDPAFGSGAVKITGAHDFNDYDVAQRGGIPKYRLMDMGGAMRADGAPYADAAAKAQAIVSGGETPDEAYVDTINLVPDQYRGLDRFEARSRVVADIDAEGLMIMVEDKKVMQPFGDRSNVVIEPMLTDQWFVDAKTLAEPAIASVREGRTRFVPQTWEKTYYDWMENIQPWCVSRQLWWGHRIPAWYGPNVDCHGNTSPGDISIPFIAVSESEALAMARDHYGADVKVSVQRDEATFADIGPQFGLNVTDRKLDTVTLYRDPDVLDTWFSSALWPFSTLGWPDAEDPALKTYYPTAVLSTAFDIIFFWVARMMMMGLHFMTDDEGRGVEPFHTVFIHPLVRDKLGQKMSKTKGNGIDPLDMIDEYGADALRFTLAILTTPGRDVKLDPQRIAGYRNFGTKLWNATRFAQMNGVAHDPGFKPDTVSLTVNRWIMTELSQATRQVSRSIENYRFDDAAAAIYRFVWNTFCDWYIELLKPVFAGTDEKAKAEARACAAFVLDEICKLLHPFMPFITEELWALTGEREGLLCHAAWPMPDFDDATAAAEINWLVELVSGIRSVRAEMNVPPSAKAPLVVVGASEETAARLSRHEAAIGQMARVEAIVIESQVPQASAQIIVDEATFCLPLGALIDVAAERARLQKAIAKVRDDMAKTEKKLANEKFIANAKPQVVAAEREKLAEAEPALERLQAALARIEVI